MYPITSIYGTVVRRLLPLFILALVAGCAGANAQTEFVEVPNPAMTMSPGAPETIWVPRSSVESGVPRGGELVKRGYESVKEGLAPSQAVTGGATVTAPQAGIAAPGGKPAAFIPRFGLVVAVDGEKVYFNLGRESGITPFQKLKVYRGGTIIEGLGLAPGALIATIEVQGFVGSGGAYGLVKDGGQPRIKDLVGAE